MVYAMLGGSWFINIMATLFIGLFDTCSYNILSVSYNIFNAVARLNLFGGNEAGQELYEIITSRFYSILSVIVIFVFAYQLVMMIIDPDGKDQKAASNLVKDTIISVIVIILMPTLFNYMALFQDHVLANNTIPAIILGTNGSEGDSPGKNISLMVLMSFYHPTGTTYSTFFDEDGALREDYSLCTEQTTASGVKNGSVVCEEFYKSLKNWKSGKGGAEVITGNSKLNEKVGEGMEYLWILCTGAAVLTSWFFIAYSIALGTRAVKLGVLQIISPIPLILRIFPHTRKTFEVWFGEIKKSYLELFLRVAIIFFVVALIQLVPNFIDVIFATSSIDNFTQSIATVCLILGLLQFAKDAPDLFKTLFSNGSGLFDGLNFSPKIRSHVESNPYAMKGIGFGTGMASGVVGAVGKRMSDEWVKSGAGDKSFGEKVGAGIKAGTLGLLSAPRGLVSGGIDGLKNSPDKLTKQSMTQSAQSGIRAAQDSLDNKRTILEWAKDTTGDSNEKIHSVIDTVTGRNRNYSMATTTAEQINETIDSMKSRADEDNKKLDERKTAIKNKVNSGELYENTLDGRKYGFMEKTVGDISKYGIRSTIDNGNGTFTFITNDNQVFVASSKQPDGDIISRSRGNGSVKLAQAQQALSTAGAFIYENKKYENLDKEFKNLNLTFDKEIPDGHSKDKTVKQYVDKDGKIYIERQLSNGNISISLKDKGNEPYYVLDATGAILRKETKNGKGKEVVVSENAQTIVSKFERQSQNERIYNVEQVYKTIDAEKNANVAKSMKENTDARSVDAKTILDLIKKGKNSFSSSYASDVHQEYTSKFSNEDIETFLARMSERNLDPSKITDVDAEKFNAIQKIIKKEITRSKTNADAEKRRKELLNNQNSKEKK